MMHQMLMHHAYHLSPETEIT